jgi:hypothetical protein
MGSHGARSTPATLGKRPAFGFGRAETRRFASRANSWRALAIPGHLPLAVAGREGSNRRPVRSAFDFWFDGGAATIQTGSIEYRFTDGTQATLAAPVPALSITIEFPNGCVVTVQQKSWGPEHAD